MSTRLIYNQLFNSLPPLGSSATVTFVSLVSRNGYRESRDGSQKRRLLPVSTLAWTGSDVTHAEADRCPKTRDLRNDCIVERGL